MSKEFTFVSIFGEGPGHSAKDVTFYVEALLHSETMFEYYMPKFSMLQLREGAEFAKHIDVRDNGSWKGAFRIASQVQVKNNSTLVFTGYTEKTVLVFWLLNFGKKYDLILSTTNNLPSGRVSRNKWRLRLFFLLLSGKLRRLVVNSEAEKMLVRSISGALSKITVIKDHHQFSRKQNLKINGVKPRISFYGPVKYYKPIEPICDLIESDLNHKYDYYIYNVGNLSNGRFEKIRNNQNVHTINTYMSEEELCLSIQSSTFIFLSHDSNYEGLLSGNFMDCMANTIPFLSGKSDVQSSFEKLYGPLGFTSDLQNANWAHYFLDGFEPESSVMFKANIAKMNDYYSQELLFESFNKSFLLDFQDESVNK